NTEQSKGSNAGFEVGVGASVGAQTGVYAYVQASAGSHKSNVDGSTWQNTQLAGQNIVLTSEGDTTLRGAVVKGDRIDAQIGGDLTIESLQDKLDIQSKESSVGGRVQVSAGTAWDASGYASGAKANGNYLGVVEQSGLFAGNGGYHVTAGNVNLIGGAIASTNAGASELTADSLTFTDLKNQMDYSASSGSISGGFGSTGNQTDANGNPIQRTAGEQSSDIGNNIANGNYGKANTGSFMPGVPMSESGSDTTYTRATLTEGTIKIGGKTTTAAATGINTDASAAHEAVATLPDVRKILGEQQAMAAAAGTVMATGKQIGDDIAASAESKANAIEAEYKNGLTQEGKDDFANLTADQRRDVLIQSNPDYRAAYEAKQQWGVGGDYSRALQAVTTALVGSVAGQGAGQVATNALAPYAAQLIGKTFDQNHGSDPNAVLQGLSHAVLGAVLAQVNGSSMVGGALAGAGGELGAQYLTKALYGDDPQAYGPDGKFDPNRLPEADKQLLVSLSQAIGAIAGGMTGGSLADAATNANIAKNAAENNYLSHPQRDQKASELQACDTEKCRESVEQKWDDTSLAQSREMKDRYFSALTPEQQSQLLNLKPGTKEYDAILAQGVLQSASKASPGLASIYNNSFQLLTETDWQGWKANYSTGGMSLEDRNRLDTAMLGIFGSPAILTAKFGGTPEQVAAANQFGLSLFDMAGVVEVFGPRTTRTVKDPPPPNNAVKEQPQNNSVVVPPPRFTTPDDARPPQEPPVQPLRVTNGVELDPRLPDPSAGLEYSPDILNSSNPNIANSHLNGYASELRLANTVANIPDEIVVKYGNKAGVKGADVVSVNALTGEVSLWDSKFRGNSANVSPSTTFKENSRALNNSVREAIADIQASSLSPDIKVKAIQNLTLGNFTANTVGSGKSKNSTTIRFSGNKQL
ncbi:hemagglutinin repeat-containing protein, partial [Xanthomonas campestris]